MSTGLPDGSSTQISASSSAACALRTDAQGRRLHKSCSVVVDTATFTRIGYAFALVAAIGASLLFALTTAGWCTADYAAFWVVVAFAAAADLLAGQQLVLAATAGWSWLRHDNVHGGDTDSDTDDADDDDVADGMRGRQRAHETSRPGTAPVCYFELHPVDGQRRYVGPLYGVPAS
jgi:hypothetical protein